MDLLIYHYDDNQLNKSILSLYKSVFNVDFSEKFQWWYLNNPNGKSIGVIAVENNDVVGHWAVSPIEFSDSGDVSSGLISLAAMIHPKMQGQGIFKKLSTKLLEYLKDLNKYPFIIGFPNNNSLFVHLNRMGYKLIGEYQFKILPRKNGIGSYSFNKMKESGIFLSNSRFSVMRSSDYLQWRYPKHEYEYWQSNNKDYFIVTRFKDTIDIILQNSTSEALEAFSTYLYEKENISSIKLWTDEQNYEIFNNRKYNFCIHVLDEKYLIKEITDKTNWDFQMGDADLF